MLVTREDDKNTLRWRRVFQYMRWAVNCGRYLATQLSAMLHTSPCIITLMKSPVFTLLDAFHCNEYMYSYACEGRE